MRAMVNGFKKNLPYIAENLPDLPQMLFKTLSKVANDELSFELKPKQLESLKREIRRGNRRSIRAIIGGSLVISASVIVGLDGIAPMMVGSGQIIVPLMSAVLAIPGILLLIDSYSD